MKTVIIESLGGYEAALKVLGKERVNWRTTSPGLLSFLAAQKVNIKSLEQDLLLDDQDGIGRAAHKFATDMSTYLDRFCYLPEFSCGAGKILVWSIEKAVYILIYKAFLLDRLIDLGDQKIVCVGDPADSLLTGLTLDFGRFETLYARLANKIPSKDVSVIEFQEDKGRLQDLERWVIDRPMGVREKTISILNNSLSSFLYKIWCNLEARGHFGLVRLWPLPKKRILVLKNCELIDELFFTLLKRGAEYQRLRLPPLLDLIKDSSEAENSLSNDGLSMQIQLFYKEALESQGIIPGGASYAACQIIEDRLTAVVSRLKNSQSKLASRIGSYMAPFSVDTVVLSNYFSNPLERLFGAWCLTNGYKTVTFEHGIGLGLSEWARYPARNSGMLLGKVGIYHWKNSLNDISLLPEHHRPLIGGIPNITKKIPFKNFQRYFARKWLGLKSTDKVVVFAADSEMNNFLYGPHIANDLQYFSSTKAIVGELVKQHPDAIIILKNYPTYRYPQSCNFDELLNSYDRLRIIKDMDFRFIRAAADLIALSSSQSTLGWALGSGCPVWFFELEISPIRLPGKQLDISVDGISRVLELDIGTILSTEESSRHVASAIMS